MLGLSSGHSATLRRRPTHQTARWADLPAPWHTGRVSEANESEELLFEGNPALLPSVVPLLVSILTAGLALLYYWLQSRATRYRITSQRVVVETGLLNKRLDQIDLYRIHDYTVERPLGQRLLGTGNLVLSTQDRSTPALKLTGLSTDVVQLYERLRKATEIEKRRRGVRVLDADPVG
jgi:membrane protein YdbS with pleckstrin-like domain